MDFRTVALLALWTLLSGPVLYAPPTSRASQRPAQVKKVSAPLPGTAVKAVRR
jgi:hypothetical protein